MATLACGCKLRNTKVTGFCCLLLSYRSPLFIVDIFQHWTTVQLCKKRLGIFGANVSVLALLLSDISLQCTGRLKIQQCFGHLNLQLYCEINVALFPNKSICHQDVIIDVFCKKFQVPHEVAAIKKNVYVGWCGGFMT